MNELLKMIHEKKGAVKTNKATNPLHIMAATNKIVANPRNFQLNHISKSFVEERENKISVQRKI